MGSHAAVARLDVCNDGVYEWYAVSSTSYVSILLPYPSCLAAIQPYRGFLTSYFRSSQIILSEDVAFGGQMRSFIQLC